MSWNHRVVRQSCTRLGVQIIWYTIYEVHYWVKEGGEDYSNISGWAEDCAPSGETVDELRTVLDLMQKCLAKPVLDLDKLEGRPHGKPRWVSLVETIRTFESEAGRGKPLPNAIREAISFVATAESMTDPFEAKLRVDGSVILEIGDDPHGSIIFKGDGRIVYACGDRVGSATASEQPMQVLKEVLARAPHRPQPGTDPDTTTGDHSIRE